MPNLDYALAYARRGWAVLPVWSVDEHGQCRCGRPNGEKGHKPGKHPQSNLVPHGHLDATTDEDVIRDWWATDPEAGIGVSLQASGLLALDIDPRHGGWESLEAIEAEQGVLHSDCTAITQGGGEHRIFLADSEMSYPGSLGAGLDLKHHGYICVAPTLGPEGEYRWAAGHSPLSATTPAEPSPLPELLLAKARDKSDRHDDGLRAASIIVAEEVYKDLRAALQVIPPDLPYDDWLKILYGMSRLHLSDKACAIAREWSVRSQKPGHTAEAFDTKWVSVMKERARTGYKTIFHFADLHAPDWRKGLTPSQSPDLSQSNPLLLPIRPFSDEEASQAKLTPAVLVEKYLYADLRNLIAAGGIGKTTMLLHEAICGALGHKIWGNKVPKPFTTVFVTKEDSREILLARLREMMAALNLSLKDRKTVYERVFAIDLGGTPFKLADVVGSQVRPNTKNLDALVEHCRIVRPDRLIFDPLISFTVGESRVNDAEQGVVEAARYLMRKLPGIAVDIVHHTGKANARLGLTDQYSGRNGSALPDGSRMVAVLTSCNVVTFSEHTGYFLDEKSNETGLRLSFPKLSYAAPPSDKFIVRSGFSFRVVPAISNDQRAQMQKARKELDQEEALKSTKNSILEAIKGMRESTNPVDRFPSRSRIIEFPGVVGKKELRKEALASLIDDGSLVELDFTLDDLANFDSTRALAGRTTFITIPADDQ